MIRVALVGPSWPYRGGIAHFTGMLEREFSRSCRVSVWNFRRLYPSFLFPGRTQFDEGPSPFGYTSSRIIDSIWPPSWRRAARCIADWNPDVVVVQWWHPFFAPSMRSVARGVRRRRRGARIVFLCHNVLPHESSVVDRVLARAGLSAADACIVQSNEDGERLRAMLPRMASVFHPHPIYDWFDNGRFTRDSARRKLGIDGPVLLFFGLVRPYKGLGVLLDAFSRVRKKLDATLLIVGEFYEERAPYDEQIRRLGIKDSVLVEDRYVPNEDVELYFRAADLAVLPYRSATQSGIVQTAFSFRLPVVVTRVGGLPDVVRDGQTGLVVEPDNPEELARAVLTFFDSDAPGRMPGAIEADLDRFSWAHCVDAVLSLAQRNVQHAEKG